MKVPAIVALLVLFAGCSGPSTGPSSSATSPSTDSQSAVCGMVPAGMVVGLVGRDLDTTKRGTLKALRAEHTPARCRVVVPGHAERYVVIVARYHPAPFQLPKSSCSQGWVYTGTAKKFAPACQDTVAGHGRTRLFVRWQPYLMQLTVGRTSRDWAGDPEQALAMSRVVAQRLGVREAAGDD